MKDRKLTIQFYIALITLFSAVSLYVLTVLDSKSAALYVALICAVVIFNIFIDYKPILITVNIGLVLLYCVTVILQSGLLVYSYIAIGIYALLTITVAFVATKIKSNFNKIETVQNESLAIQESNSPYFGKSQAFKWDFALKTIDNELSRSQNFNHSLTMMFLTGNNFDEGTIEKIIETISMFSGNFSTIFVSPENFIGLIMPEVDKKDALGITQKLVDFVQIKTRLPLYVGLAVFPADGFSTDELVDSAKERVEFAKNTQRRIVHGNPSIRENSARVAPVIESSDVVDVVVKTEIAEVITPSSEIEVKSAKKLEVMTQPVQVNEISSEPVTPSNDGERYTHKFLFDEPAPPVAVEEIKSKLHTFLITNFEYMDKIILIKNTVSEKMGSDLVIVSYKDNVLKFNVKISDAGLADLMRYIQSELKPVNISSNENDEYLIELKG